MSIPVARCSSSVAGARTRRARTSTFCFKREGAGVKDICGSCCWDVCISQIPTMFAHTRLTLFFYKISEKKCHKSALARPQHFATPRVWYNLTSTRLDTPSGVVLGALPRRSFSRGFRVSREVGRLSNACPRSSRAVFPPNLRERRQSKRWPLPPSCCISAIPSGSSASPGFCPWS